MAAVSDGEAFRHFELTRIRIFLVPSSTPSKSSFFCFLVIDGQNFHCHPITSSFVPNKMLLNYHEMTMNAPADSPDKRRQFAFISAVMVAALSYSVMTSGVMLPLEPTQGVFPGGTFCYKVTNRDYAASMGLGRRVTKDVIGSEKSTGVERREVEKVLYHMFFDNPFQVGGRYLRWATGILVPDGQKETVDKLLSLNTPIGTKATTKRYPTESELMDSSAGEIFQMLPYEVATLPAVDALVVQFPHTHGFVSALVMSYKVRHVVCHLWTVNFFLSTH